MIVQPGQEALLVSIEPVSLHGERYFDVVVADPDAPDDPGERIRARLGPESIEGEPVPGDRVRIDGFLRTVTRVAAL